MKEKLFFVLFGILLIVSSVGYGLAHQDDFKIAACRKINSHYIKKPNEFITTGFYRINCIDIKNNIKIINVENDMKAIP